MLKNKDILKSLRDTYLEDVTILNEMRTSEETRLIGAKGKLPTRDLTWKAVVEEYAGTNFSHADLNFASGAIGLELPRYIATQMNNNPDKAYDILDEFVRRKPKEDKSLYDILDKDEAEWYIYKQLRKALRTGKEWDKKEFDTGEYSIQLKTYLGLF